MTDNNSSNKFSRDDLSQYQGLTETEPSLPSDWYYDAHWYTQEVNQIFYKSWIYLCHQSSILENRGYRCFTVGDQNIILLKGDEGEFKAYHNTCRHRGSILCENQNGRFHNGLIRCPYHQWAYDIQGQLISTSSHWLPDNFHKADFSLLPVHVHNLDGGLFICLAKEPPPISESFERGSDRTENWPMQTLKIGHTWSKTLKCNWKIFWENFNECVHCPNIHPELCDLVPIYGRRVSYPQDVPGWQNQMDSENPAFTGGLRKGADSWSMDGSALPYKFSELNDEEIKRGQSYFVSLPSVFIAAHVDYMRTVRILPTGPETTHISVEWLFPAETLEDKSLDLENVIEFGKRVLLQDGQISELNQRGIKAHAFKEGVLMPEEHYVKGFQDWVRTQMEGID